MSLTSLPVRVPTLDELAADPALVTPLPAAALTALLHRCKAVEAALEVEIQARVLNALGNAEGRARAAEDDLLPLEETARTLGIPPERLRRQWRRYPFARKASRRAEPVFSRHGLLAWIAGRRA